MLTPGHVFAQNTPWHFIPEKNLEKAQFQRTIAPENYRVVSLNTASFGQILNQAPERFSDDQTENYAFIELPLPDGSFAPFRVEKWSVLHPNLALKFPEIQTFIAYGLDDPTAVARLDLTPNGFHGMIRSRSHPAIFIDPYSPKTTEYYQVYYRSELNPTPGHAFQCLFNEANKNAENVPLDPVGFAEQSDCTLRVYRLAVACTGEYATYHGGTVASVLSAITTTINRVNGIFEDEMAISLQLVANNDQLIFLDPATDPYTNSDGVSMLSENQTTVDNLIGSANYDIGHVFSTGGGGVAYLGSVCNNNIKAGGVTGHANPVGDAFDVDYVTHEMGHQFGATHTQNNDCNRSATTSMEPGSASTIMGYAGVCSPNIQTHSDDYFHAVSLQQIAAFIAGNGSCAAQIVTGNNAPTANAGADFTIPAGTPFALTGTG
ncbi:MAG: propanediol utilization protein, partial [Bacteroidetes bacterium]